MVTRCCGVFQARSPVRSVVCRDGIGPEEGGSHAFGHGCCLVISAAMFLQSRPLVVAYGAVQEILSPTIGWRKFCDQASRGGRCYWRVNCIVRIMM